MCHDWFVADRNEYPLIVHINGRTLSRIFIILLCMTEDCLGWEIPPLKIKQKLNDAILDILIDRLFPCVFATFLKKVRHEKT
jgi:hypothetical protein